MARTRKMVNLSIEETSGVDHPAHLHEGWLVMKASDPVEKAAKTEDGTEFPAEAYAYVPDPESPSTWKLRLWETPEDKVTARQVGMAVAALGVGFRGQKVQIPSGDLEGVKAKVRAAWMKANPDRGESDLPPVLKSTEEVEKMEDDMEKAEDTMSFEDMKAALEKANARIAEMEKEMGGKKKKDDGELPEFLRKEAPEEVRKAFEDMQKAIDSANVLKAAAEETLLKERADRADADAIVKARESYGALGLDAQMVGPALRRLSDTDSDLAKSVEQTLLAANAKVESADIFSEIGKGSLAAFGDAYGQAEAMAKSAVAEGRVSTFEQALTEVYASNPGLYDQYLAEQGK